MKIKISIVFAFCVCAFFLGMLITSKKPSKPSLEKQRNLEAILPADDLQIKLQTIRAKTFKFDSASVWGEFKRLHLVTVGTNEYYVFEKNGHLVLLK